MAGLTAAKGTATTTRDNTKKAVTAVENYIKYFKLDKARSAIDLAAVKAVLAPLNDALIIAKAAEAVQVKLLAAENKTKAALVARRDLKRPAGADAVADP